MIAANIKTPGVYIDERNALGNSVVPIATAVPAFIGYTPQAEYNGQSYLNMAHKISSFAEFSAIYTLPNPEPPASPAKQYAPNYYLVLQSEKPTRGGCIAVNGTYFSILPDPNTIYYLYNSIRLFYQNGGGDAYIVSVGTYGEPSGQPLATPGDPLVNINVQKPALEEGLKLLLNEEEPTMYICPEATLLNDSENSALMQDMLAQANQMQTTVCLLDIIGGRNPDPITYENDIETFRNNTGSQGLKYGVSYYPFVGTTVMSSSDLDYTNLFGGNTQALGDFLNSVEPNNENVKTILETLGTPPEPPPPPAPDTEPDAPQPPEDPPPAPALTTEQNNNALLNASTMYQLVMDQVLNEANILPPSGGMAGIYTTIDNQRGVWQAPANVSMTGVTSLPIFLSSSQQANLNVDAISGKSINAIRFFNGQGILVWGARTLDGNSHDWRYVSVRRTVTFLEQSIKAAARAYVFEPNDDNTWASIQGVISSFLTDIWKVGGLQGAEAEDAFQVEIGLGSTMTPEDLLNGFLKVTVRVAVVRPAEFIVITFEQQMAQTG